jgi:hypothetical protein
MRTAMFSWTMIARLMMLSPWFGVLGRDVLECRLGVGRICRLVPWRRMDQESSLVFYEEKIYIYGTQANKKAGKQARKQAGW